MPDNGTGRVRLRANRGILRRWGRVASQDDTESPGAGRAKLRLSRGFPRGLVCGIIPYEIGLPN